jgi:hypothetical protein
MDPEALLLLTFEVGRNEPRLFEPTDFARTQMFCRAKVRRLERTGVARMPNGVADVM